MNFFNRIKKYDGLPNDPGGELLWRLSELQKMPFLKGRLIHDAVQNQISNHRAGRNVDRDTARNFFLAQFNNSMKNLDIVLAEAANGFPPGEKEKNFMREDGLKQVENFCNLILDNYRNVEYIGHEKNESFFIDDIDESVQMGTYILWLHEATGKPAELIKGEIVYLRSCVTEITGRTDEQLVELAEFIKEDAAEMLAVADESSFPASPKPGRCMGCNFLKVCEEGKEAVADMRPA